MLFIPVNEIELKIKASTCNLSNTSVSFGYPNTEKRVENKMGSGVFLTKFKVFINIVYVFALARVR